jgi:N-acetylmuramoyl-L-alanine amidase
MNVKFLMVHCAATKPSMDVDAAWINRVHVQRGFIKIGYHYFIKRNGTVQKGRADTERGAHAYNYNSIALGICMAGGVKEADGKTPETNFTAEQWDSLKELLRVLAKRHPGVKIIGHNDTYPTACPTFDVKEWVKRELPDLLSGEREVATASIETDAHDEFMTA